MGSPTEQIGPIQKELFKIAMKGEWDKVVEKYKGNPRLHKAKITRSGDTALHIAVSDLQEDVVEQLVGIICKKGQAVEALDIQNDRAQAVEALNIQNDRGNTPLHTAASMGSVRMCKCIASVDPKVLIAARNLDRETPFFLAALHGKKYAFLHLHSMCTKGEEKKGYSYCRRNDGDTILHCAIAGDYFDLAFQIIHHYPNLVNYVNEQGLSPLHLLATKHSAFRSGSRLSGWFNKIIYHCCIFVDELKPEEYSSDHHPSLLEPFEDEKNPKYPENYRTCINLVRLLCGLAKVVCGRATTFKKLAKVVCGRPDAEKPKNESRESANDNVNKIAGQMDVENQGNKCVFTYAWQSTNELEARQLLPDNYGTCINFIKLLSKAMLIILGLGSTGIKKLQEKKEKHTWSVQIMNELVTRASTYEYEYNGMSRQELPTPQKDDETLPYAFEEGGTTISEQVVDQSQENGSSTPKDQENKGKNGGQDDNAEGAINWAKKETPKLIPANNGITEMVEKILQVAIRDMNTDKKNLVLLAVDNGQGVTKWVSRKETPVLIAAKNGITEMVKKILEFSPVAIHDMNTDKKNIVLLAVENRQPHVYQLLLKRSILKDIIFSKVDINGNSALHLAAMLGEHRPWLIPGAALQMQWEIKWFEFVKESMPLHFFARYNKDGKTAREVFTESHMEFVKNGGEWLTKTSESCSVVAALIATVAFATSATVPGGVKQDSGTPTLEDVSPFNVFAFASLVALCFSVTAVVMFLAILTSRFQERDFGKSLPRRLLIGLTSLFVSITAMLISFCAGHFFVLKDELQYVAFPVYVVTCLPVTFFAIAQFPLYIDLMWATIKKIPQRSYKVISP